MPITGQKLVYPYEMRRCPMPLAGQAFVAGPIKSDVGGRPSVQLRDMAVGMTGSGDVFRQPR